MRSNIDLTVSGSSVLEGLDRPPAVAAILHKAEVLDGLEAKPALQRIDALESPRRPDRQCARPGSSR